MIVIFYWEDEITGDTLSDGGGIGGSSIARELEARSGLVQFFVQTQR